MAPSLPCPPAQERCSTSVRMAWRAGMFTDPTTGQPYILSLLVLLLDVATGVEHLHARNVVHGEQAAACGRGCGASRPTGNGSGVWGWL